jgi:hypothetical protein
MAKTGQSLRLDLDAFFCSATKQLDPTIKGKAVVAGAKPSERGALVRYNFADPLKYAAIYIQYLYSVAKFRGTQGYLRGNRYRRALHYAHQRARERSPPKLTFGREALIAGLRGLVSG